MINLEKKYLNEIKRILRLHAPEFEVRAYGSRVNGSAEKYSDLDLALVVDSLIDWRKIITLKNAFSESNLPIIIDIVDWHSLKPAFKKLIAQEYEVIQEAAKQSNQS